MNPILFAIPIFGLTILLEAWWAHRRGLDLYNIPDAVTSLHFGVLSQVANMFTKLVTLGIYVAVYQVFRAATWPTDSVIVWLLAVLMYDFFYYWHHRLNHEVAVMWAAHVVHHSSERFNLSTALRQSSSTALLGWVFYLPMAVVGIPPELFVAAGLINLLYQYWPHTQLVGKLGWVDRLFVTPSNHRVHHGQNDYCMDVNYGGILIVWDRLFGTFAEERDEEPVCFGVRKPLASYNPVWGNLHYYAELWRESCQASGWRAKVGLWLAPPGGWTTGPVPHFDSRSFAYFDPGPTAALRRYAVLHYVVTTLMLLHFLAVFKQLDMAQASGYGLVLATAALALGGLLERRAWARWVELTRLLVMGAAFALLPRWFGLEAPAMLRALVALAALASVAWLWGRDVSAPASSGVSA